MENDVLEEVVRDRLRTMGVERAEPADIGVDAANQADEPVDIPVSVDDPVTDLNPATPPEQEAQETWSKEDVLALVQHMRASNQEVDAMRALQEAAKSGDYDAVFKALGVDPTQAYTDWTVKGLDADKNSDALKEVRGQLETLKGELEMYRRERAEMEERASVATAKEYLLQNKDKFPLLSEGDDGTVLWGRVREYIDTNRGKQVDWPKAVERIAEQLEVEKLKQIEKLRPLLAIAERGAPANKPTKTAQPRTVTNKTAGRVPDQSIEDVIKGISDPSRVKDVLLDHYANTIKNIVIK